jgi:DNA-binding response OmpR family regulator
MRLLLIEDNLRLAEFTALTLVQAGFAVDTVHAGEDGLAALATTAYDVVVLDRGLPDGDGLSVLTGLRNRGDTTPVLVLTARDGVGDRVNGLNLGADDYLVKPFDMDELTARIRVLLRRPGRVLGVDLTLGNVSLDTVGRRARVDGVALDLSRREIGALELLLRRGGRVVAKPAFETALYSFGEEVGGNAIEVLIHRLRKRLHGAGATAFIHTLRGIGYMLSEDRP